MNSVFILFHILSKLFVQLNSDDFIYSNSNAYVYFWHLKNSKKKCFKIKNPEFEESWDRKLDMWPKEKHSYNEENKLANNIDSSEFL